MFFFPWVLSSTVKKIKRDSQRMAWRVCGCCEEYIKKKRKYGCLEDKSEPVAVLKQLKTEDFIDSIQPLGVYIVRAENDLRTLLCTMAVFITSHLLNAGYLTLVCAYLRRFKRYARTGMSKFRRWGRSVFRASDWFWVRPSNLHMIQSTGIDFGSRSG